MKFNTLHQLTFLLIYDIREEEEDFMLDVAWHVFHAVPA
jgi:hypothetical protein